MTNLLGAIDVLKTAGYALIAILGIMVMITVHEFGHYIAGKLFGFKINEFAIGMGPAIIKKEKKNGEIFSVRALPLGGFCAFEGEDEENPSENAFNNKAPWKRIIVLAAGATMNYLLALIIIIVSTNVYGASALGAVVVKDTGVEAEYLSESLESGDYILSIKKGDKTTGIYLATDFISALNHSKKGETVYAEVFRGENEIKTVAVKLREDVECKNLTEIDKVYAALGFGSAMQVTVNGESGAFSSGDYIIKYKTADNYADCDFVFDAEAFRRIFEDKTAGDTVEFYVSRNGERVLTKAVLGEDFSGVDKTDAAKVLGYFGITSFDYAYYTGEAYRKIGFFRSLPRSVGYSVKVGGTILRTLGELLTGRLGLNSVGGTVTTIVTTTKIMSYGAVYALEIFAFIGVNLAVFNLLPIPALDGSRIVFCIIEWIRKKPISRKVEGIIHAVGFAFILGFAILVDILQFI